MKSGTAVAVLCCFALASVAPGQRMAPAPAPMVQTDQAKIAEMSASDFVYAPALLSTPNMSASINSQRMLKQWPALEGAGISQTAFILGACSLRPPHAHLRATGLLYLISGSIQVGFVSEDGKQAYVNNITAGSSTIFPLGLIHYQQNLGCEPAVYTISYNHEEPGTQVSVAALMGLPAEVANAALGWNNLPTGQDAMLMSVAPTSTFVTSSDPTCVQQCAASLTSTAAGVSMAANTAGR